MHEFGICRTLLEQVARIAEAHDATAVHRVGVRVGALSGVEPELLARAFPHAAAGTVAANAELAIDRRPVRVACDECHVESAVPSDCLRCPACGYRRTRLIGGDELLLADIELETPDVVASAE